MLEILYYVITAKEKPMQKIPQRKDRKRLKRSIDRSSHSERKKKHVMLTAELNQLAWDISRVLPKKRSDGLNDHYICPICHRHFCRNFHNDMEYCKSTCYWGMRNACGKAIKGIKLCDECDERRRNEKSSRSKNLSTMLINDERIRK